MKEVVQYYKNTVRMTEIIVHFDVVMKKVVVQYVRTKKGGENKKEVVPVAFVIIYHPITNQ